MKALRWHGPHNVRVDNVPDPEILNPRDAILRVTSTAICGSDLHLYDGVIPSMKPGDILGHEFMGEIVAVGDAAKLKVGDRVVVPFAIGCGRCWFCEHDLWSACDNSNPNAAATEALYGQSPSALFGYSHLFGGYAGGQAEYVRVPFADVALLQVPEHLTDEQVLFLTDIFPTGYQAVDVCNVQPGDTVAVWGCGPVGQFAVQSAFLLGAERVIAIDDVPERLRLAESWGRAETLDFSKVSVPGALKEMTGGRGPDICIDAVGLEAHGMTLGNAYDQVKQKLLMATDRPDVLRQAILSCRKAGTVSIPGVYGGLLDKIPMGAAFGKGLTFKMGQTHVHRYLRPLLDHIEHGRIDPTRLITHRFALEEAKHAYHVFSAKQENCIKVVLKPQAVAARTNGAHNGAETAAPVGSRAQAPAAGVGAGTR